MIKVRKSELLVHVTTRKYLEYYLDIRKIITD
jgi:hypothetical protein